MADHSFEGFSPEALIFLEDLENNNDREWFADHKRIYETEIKQPAAAFCEVMEAGLAQRTGTPHRSKVFRIHRDVRFSKDKRPYNAHLHIAFTPKSTLKGPPMLFFGLGTNQLSLGCGVFAFDKAELETFRHRVIGPEGAKLAKILKAQEDTGMRLSAPALKRVPAGFDKEHPRAELLRQKGLGVWLDFLDRSWVTGPNAVSRTLDEFDRLRPVSDWLLRNLA